MESFNIGRTLSRAFSLVIDTIASVGVFILVIQIVNVGVQFVMRRYMMAGILGAQKAGNPAAALAMFGSGWYWGLMLFSLLLGSLSFAGGLHGLLRAANHETVSLADCFSAGLAKMLPVLGLTILWYLSVVLGSILLIVPGLILMTMWSVALPALVGENLGVFTSFGRSRELTRGSRMVIFLTLLIFLILLYVGIFMIMGAAIGGGMMGFSMIARANPWATLWTIPTGWIFSSLLNALLVSIYLETVTIKEGGVPGRLVHVFD